MLPPVKSSLQNHMPKVILQQVLEANKFTLVYDKSFRAMWHGFVPKHVLIISQRRINYSRHILSRNNDELIKKVFLAQKEKLSKGDFVQLVEKDLNDFGITYTNISYGVITKQKLKCIAQEKAFQSLLVN